MRKPCVALTETEMKSERETAHSTCLSLHLRKDKDRDKIQGVTGSGKPIWVTKMPQSKTFW